MKTDIKLQTEEMDKLLCRLLWCQLRSMDCFSGTEINVDALKTLTRTSVREIYGRWLDESIAVLTRNNYLRNNGSTYIVIDPAPLDLETEWHEWDRKTALLRQNPDLKARIDLAGAMLRVLPEILTGKTLATDILFPNSSMVLVEGIYKNNTVADCFNEILANTVFAYIQKRLEKDPSARINIIEIGAGTGGTSAKVFRKLATYQDNIQEYCYTDISKAFLMHAEEEYGPENPYLTYRIFNVERPITGQEISAGGYDIAIAANVLHATKSISKTLQNAKAVLKRNGLLLLNEMSNNSLFLHLTFGLLEGWWLYEDPALRVPGSPALSPETWQKVLETEGFRSVFFPAQKVHDWGQQIIVAESDGVVCQSQQPAPPDIKLVQAPAKKQIMAKALPEAVIVQNASTIQSKGIPTELLREKTTTYIKKLVGETLKIPGHKLDSAMPLESYGIDSILVVQLANKLGKTLKDINSTLFFEYQTIDALVEHFIRTQKDSLINLLGLAERVLKEELPSEEEKIALSSPIHSNLRRSGRFRPLGDLKIQTSRVQEIAIIGLSGRYPGANNVNEYWQNIKAGKNCISEIPKERWDWREYYTEEKDIMGSINTKWGGFINDIDKFDPLFFQIAPRDAENMDPQERIFLEEAYASIEDAGYTPATLCDSRKIGVFVGVANTDYPTGASYWSIANRISYLFNLQGPSMAVDTACSSSLTAVHLALESLNNGSCDCAIAGGVNLIIDPEHYLKLSGTTMLSVSDQCKPFGAGADGFVDGEGVGAVILKPLSKAEACGDHIYGIIKGSMVNAGGKTNGYTVPNPAAQREVIRAALDKAGVNARAISYIEAGTGTKLGDSIEITGLTQAFRKDTEETGYCAIGSVKSNIGHLEAAAGIAGLTKVILQMKHRQIVPSLHAQELNPNIDFSKTPFVVQQELTEWGRPVVTIEGVTKEYPRIAGISSFGAGGSNAHVIIEEYIPRNQEQTAMAISSQNPAIMVLSAKNEERLKEKVRQLLAAIRDGRFADDSLACSYSADGDLDDSRLLADMAYTLQVGREAMEERLAMSVGSIKELAEKLQGFLEDRDGMTDFYHGQVKLNKETMTVLAVDEDMDKTIDAWTNKRKYSKLLDLWVKGLAFDWNKLYGDQKPYRISLPTYPFASESYWVSDNETQEKVALEFSSRTLESEIAETGSPIPVARARAIDTGSLKKTVQDALKRTVSNLLKVKIENIDLTTELSEYGFDSISLTQFANILNEEYMLELNPTVFFEYPMLYGLAEYLIKEHQAVLAAKFKLQVGMETPSTFADNATREDARARLFKYQPKRSRFVEKLIPVVKPEISANEIAIVGMSGIFPQARDLEEFWNNLVTEKDCITEIPKERWDWKEYYGDPHQDVNKTNIKWGGFIDGVAEFDPLFFGISPREAELMDPQQRLLMTYVWKALEDAGYSAESLSGTKTGIFAGTSGSGYDGLIARANLPIEGYSSTGIVTSIGPNRMSYFLNIHGPSEPIETACSSSLVAIHRAVNAIENGTCEMAIVGGINTILTPWAHISFNKTGMLCEDGRCKTFSEKANGYARGEGVGMLFLKKLKDAEQAGDHIYGIIRGTAENHGGRANSLTAPNPKAQAELLQTAYRKAGVDPRTVTYIEAHGTGTELGDPIEINGLKMAFKELYQATGDPAVVNSHCGLGSLKTNIGHVELAAGVAGVIKVLMQMKHKTLVKSLHCETINPFIQLKDSPFYIVQEQREWEALRDADGREIPRRAGVSSFGFGGVNAHVVIEEYIPKEIKKSTIIITDRNPALIVISAKNEERLKERAQQLIDALRERQFSDDSLADGYIADSYVAAGYLADMAYTLQVGREAMEERLGVVTSSTGELIEKLTAFLNGQSDIINLYHGQVKRNQEALTVITADEEMQDAIQKWIERKKYGKLLELWVKGLVFDWNKLYGDQKPCRISLPTYPFAKEHYWVPETRGASVETRGRASLRTRVHPLLHQNTSDLSEQRYSSTFTGKEFFLAHYVVRGQKVLPGVACLEMARAAIEASWPAAITKVAGNLTEDARGRVIKLKNVVWARPIEVDEEPVQIHIGLYPEEGGSIEAGAYFEGEIAYDIYSLAENGESEETRARLVYCQGTAALSGDKENQRLDLKSLQAECNGTELIGSEVYNIYKTIGLDYGPGLQGIEAIYTGPGLVLAKLSLPSSVTGTEDDFVLHPSIMDGALQAAALQAAIGMRTGESKIPGLSLPSALEELEIYCAHARSCTGSMWAVIQNSKDNAATDKIQKLDIDLCDEQGQVCVRLKGFSSRILEGGTDETAPAAAIGSIMFEPVWKEQAGVNIDDSRTRMAKSPEFVQQLVILCELGAREGAQISPESIETGLKRAFAHEVKVLSLRSKQKSIPKRYQTYAVCVFEALQNIIADKSTGKVLVQLVVANREAQQVFVGLSGILKTAQLENPKVVGQIIEVEAIEDPEGLISKLKENAHPDVSRQSMDSHVRYQGGKRQVAGWSEVTVLPEATEIPFKDGGVYLITGGAGGLGMIFAKEITLKTKEAVLILSGQSPLGEAKQLKLKKLESPGTRIEYRSADISDGKAVNELIGSIVENFSKLDGIIHCAGIIRDNYILKKTKEELMEVLAPKVAGLINLDMATENLNLDFMILFSSISGIFGNPGQADYAAANAFMDAYARYRNDLVTNGERKGRTLSINWPLWQEGGMRVDETVEKMLRQNTGMTAMRTWVGIRGLYQALAFSKEQVMIMEGELAKIRGLFQANSSEIQTQPPQAPVTIVPSEALLDKTIYQLKALFGEVTKLAMDRIETDEPLESYGIDSLMVTQLNQKLAQIFGAAGRELSKTIFYEYLTLRALAKYLVGQYPQECMKWTGIGGEIKTRAEVSVKTIPLDDGFPVLSARKHGKQRDCLKGFNITKANREPIAIIGLSGRYPQAKDIQDFWDNLANGKDCITEIPAERWPLEGFYHANPEEAIAMGKSYSKWGGFVEGFAEFDPLFFNIAPREAFNMDPQERLFIESCWEVLEDAGYTKEQLAEEYHGRVGVFAGITKTGFDLYGPDLWRQGESIFPHTSFGSVANRVSYLLNLQGPSMPIDTMCSSSLTAIHEACEHLYRGECEMAIAGGVNLYLHPATYISLCGQQMLSKDGTCKSFGKGGNGFIPGEGVGTVLLKPLSRAIADEDQIYAVILGASINHGGKTNGYTVPNPKAQGELIRATLEKSGINARTVSFIEAHGTGTELGDPIEVAGLTQAFRKDTEDMGYCAIGSVKSNIGHLEAAAGIAGLTKIVLQMKHRQLVPSLHSKELNPNIDFIKTPFIIQQELTEWERPVITIDGITKEYPRIAGISSFGAGGSNAHVIIEEYVAPEKGQTISSITRQNSAIIVLSAKNEEQLKEQAEQLLTAIKIRRLTDDHLADLAYTLQVGREAMEERLAMMVDSIKELTEKLQGFLESRYGGIDLYRGQIKRNKETLAVLAVDEDMAKTIDAWISKRKYGKLLDLWVKGLAFDWNRIYGETYAHGCAQPRRLSLPTYPFARERYWIPVGTRRGAYPQVGFIHPLLQQNTSDLSEQRYSSTFTGREFFLKDHVIMGQKVLPEVVYLEMARAAVAKATGCSEVSNATIQLKNVIWVHSFEVDEQPAQIHIGLYPEDDAFFESGCAFMEGDGSKEANGSSLFEGEITYEIYSLAGTNETEALRAHTRTVYCQGKAALADNRENPEISVLDLKSLQAECNQRKLSGAEVYSTYKASGVEYGPGYQGIETIYAGPDRLIAKLSLPDSVADTVEQFVLHPSILYAALQAVIGMEAGETANRACALSTPKSSMPFALQKLEIYCTHACCAHARHCTRNMWAVIGYSKGNPASDKVRKLDIDICDEQGQVCARLKGLEMQEQMEVNSSQVVVSETQKQPYELMTFEEFWQEQALPEASFVPLKTIVCFLAKPENQTGIVDAFSTFEGKTNLIFISQGAGYQKQTPQNYCIARADRNSYEEAFRSIRVDYHEIDAIVYMWALEDSSLIKDYSGIVYIIQAMATAGLRTKRILLAASYMKDSIEGCYADSWIGFERSSGMTLPNTQIAVIYYATGPDQETAMKDWGQKLRDELHTPRLRSVLYQNRKRYIYKIRPILLPPVETSLRAGGTYLITGGCGGLGFLLAKYIAQKHPVNLVLTGRSAMDAEKQKKIKLLEDLGSQVIYLQANVSNTKTMKAGLKQARERFGRIDGVIHAAGIAGTGSILEKGLEDFQIVVEPKIAGTQGLDKVLKEEPLDFICYFSSAAAILGDFGSCDYAVGNRFEMAYAHYRNRQNFQGLAHGKAIVINWPLWKDGGMGFDNDENTKLYLKTSGQRVLETEEGMALFDQIMGQNLRARGTQYLVIAGQPKAVHRFLGLTEEQPVAPPVIKSSSLDKRSRKVEMKGLSVEQRLEWDLKEQISNLLKIPKEKIARDENLADFGFDSISLGEFASLLTNFYGIEITPAIFFGYSTLGKLTQYFYLEHQETIRQFYKEEDEQQFIQVNIPTLKPQIIKPARFKRSGFSKNHAQDLPEPIAIIGMSGRFPGARNIDELWTILATGADMVKEIPKERFDWRQYYGGPSIQPGKTICKWCGCIPGVDEFEPLFFEISPREAETMDPRQRLLLQEAWRALEDAGYGSEQIKREKIGMFVGAEQGDYQLITQGAGEVTANSNAILAARLAYFLNLNGPVMAIDTACSSGLTAAHQACWSLRNGECDTAIAAGVNLSLAPGTFIRMSEAGMLSGDGKCFAFDKRANGIVPGEAVAVIVCKRLSQAEADGDPIYAVIRGSGINYDGKTNGITAPNGISQTGLLKTVYDQYRINPEEIEYIVAHGTGTKLGDPVEINALYNAFKDYTKKEGYCALTSTKTNLGHTSAASGLVSVISLVQALRHKMIPVSLHCEQENDYINWKESPFFVNKTNRPWPGEKTRKGAVSAFGMSGTNVHMIVESYSGVEADFYEKQPFYLLALSAKTRETLLEKVQDMIAVLESETSGDLASISYTLLEGRQHFHHRCAIVVQEREDAIHALKEVESIGKIPSLFQGKVPQNFKGQKAFEQYALELLKQSRALKENKSKYHEILCALADLYCQGYELEWKQLFGDIKPKRIHLPTYPFMKEHYWAPVEPHGRAALQAGFIQPRLDETFDETFYDRLMEEVMMGRIDTAVASSKTRQRIATTGKGEWK